jgi:hypothetical protein
MRHRVTERAGRLQAYAPVAKESAVTLRAMNFGMKETDGYGHQASGHPDDMPVWLEIDAPEEGIDLAQAQLRHVAVECRCDGDDTLYLWGSIEDDLEEYAETQADNQ